MSEIDVNMINLFLLFGSETIIFYRINTPFITLFSLLFGTLRILQNRWINYGFLVLSNKFIINIFDFWFVHYNNSFFALVHYLLESFLILRLNFKFFCLAFTVLYQKKENYDRLDWDFQKTNGYMLHVIFIIKQLVIEFLHEKLCHVDKNENDERTSFIIKA